MTNKRSKDLQMKVLIIDDSEAMCVLIEACVKLTDPNVECLIAHDGLSGLEIFKSQSPHLVFIDNEMPEMNGKQCCKEIRKIQPPDLQPIIMMISSYTEQEQRLDAYEHGIDDYILKPVEKLELMCKIKNAIAAYRAKYRLKQKVEDLQSYIDEQAIEAARQTQLAELGREVAEIIHNLNSPLTIIKSSFDLIETTGPKPRYFELGKNAIASLKDIISSILKVGKSSANTQLTEVDVNDVLKDIVNLIRASKHIKDVKISSNFANIPKVRAVYSDLSQVFSNLINNSIDALLDNSGEKSIHLTTQVIPEGLTISVKDNGCGIAQEDLEKIFQPFYTTKNYDADSQRPSGTGLGMAYCQKMISSYGGKISVSSKVGEGTEMRIFLPS